MSLEIYVFTSLPESRQYEIANLIADYTHGKLGETPQMLPVQPSGIINKYAGLIVDDDEQFAGYIGATEPVNHDGVPMSEVGTLWVPEQHRNNGYAHILVGGISKVIARKGVQPFAFCNPLSKPIFSNNGYEIAAPTQVPQEAFCLCADCPAKPSGGGCCDEILLYTGGTNDNV